MKHCLLIPHTSTYSLCNTRTSIHDFLWVFLNHLVSILMAFFTEQNKWFLQTIKTSTENKITSLEYLWSLIKRSEHDWELLWIHLENISTMFQLNFATWLKCTLNDSNFSLQRKCSQQNLQVIKTRWILWSTKNVSRNPEEEEEINLKHRAFYGCVKSISKWAVARQKHVQEIVLFG